MNMAPLERALAPPRKQPWIRHWLYLYKVRKTTVDTNSVYVMLTHLVPRWSVWFLW